MHVGVEEIILWAILDLLCISPPHIGIQVTFSYELISSQISVVWCGDEVAGDRLVHVLVRRCVALVEHAAVFGLHVSEEPFKCHELAFYRWRRRKEPKVIIKIQCIFLNLRLRVHVDQNPGFTLEYETVVFAVEQ